VLSGQLFAYYGHICAFVGHPRAYALFHRAASPEGIPLKIATAVMIVDLTIGVVTKVMYMVAAGFLLVAVTGRADLTRPTLAAAVTGTLAAAGSYAVQRLGIFRRIATFTSRLAGSPVRNTLVESGEALDQEIALIYARRRGTAGCYLFWILSWFVASGEIWISLRALGFQSSFTTAIILESAALAIRGAAFLVPGTVQEGTYVVVGNLLGVPGDIALALSLVRRIRELALGIPALLWWQLMEARILWHGRRSGSTRKSH
jgi:putative membrane protein